ncbi:MAG: selenide, water dikinase SelD, partial [Dehalococcoidia bacterium]|nr:selenide, water dikinase SelD [Dehalococcoidia bacterium]
VYKLTDDIALVQTVDLFTPVVDDPYSFGAIAVANALSDVYAMGGKPITALNIVCFPARGLPLEILAEILKGGSDKAREADTVIIGGHTLDDKEPKYGLAVTGIVHPGKIITNAGARVGDDLVLTKPLGIGIITTAHKANLVSAETVKKITELMATLNKAGAEAMIQCGIDSATDVTGFGLLGHLHEMTLGSKVGARIWADKVPVIPETWEIVEDGLAPGGTYNNLKFLENSIVWGEGITLAQQLVFCDAQTSGGLLIAVPKERTRLLIELLEQARTPVAAHIGEIVEDEQGRIWVEGAKG